MVVTRPTEIERGRAWEWKRTGVTFNLSHNTGTGWHEWTASYESSNGRTSHKATRASAQAAMEEAQFWPQLVLKFMAVVEGVTQPANPCPMPREVTTNSVTGEEIKD